MIGFEAIPGAVLDFGTLLVGFVTFLLVYFWYRRGNKAPPGPRGVPILGVIPWIGKIPAKTMRKWSKKYGPVMSVRLGLKDWVVLNDYETIQEVC